MNKLICIHSFIHSLVWLQTGTRKI